MTDRPVSPGSGHYPRPSEHRGGPLSRRDFVLTSAGILIPASIALAAQNSSIRVTVTGLLSTATTGGTVVVTRTDVSGQSPVTAQVSSSGSARISAAPGTYSVQYTPPSGYVLAAGQANPQTTSPGSGRTGQVTFGVQAQVVQTATQTQTTSGTAPDIYGFGFEDGTAGLLKGGSGQDPLTIGWLIDSSTAAGGTTKSMKQNYPMSTGNVGVACYYRLPTTRQAYYCRFAYRQSSPFNNNGTTNNASQVKVQRGIGPGLNFQAGSFFIGIGTGSNGQPAFGWDGLAAGTANRTANRNLPAPNFNNLLGTWHWIETFWDISTSGALHFMCWIDNVLYFDYTDSLSNINPSTALPATYQFVQFDGTVNSMASGSTAWFDEIGISSQKMGIP